MKLFHHRNTLASVKHAHAKYKLEQLLPRIPKGYKAEEVDWGKPAGKEVW